MPSFKTISSLKKSIQHHHDDELKAILNNGIHPDTAFTDQDHPVMLAIKHHNMYALQLLVDFGASLDFEDKKGITPLVMATKEGSLDMIRTLIDARIDIHYLNKHNRKSLDDAIKVAREDGMESVICQYLMTVKERSSLENHLLCDSQRSEKQDSGLNF